MKKLKLRRDKENEWANRPVVQPGRKCERGGEAYCLGTFPGQKEAVKGFLGQWGRLMNESNTRQAWPQISERKHRLVRDLVAEGQDKYKWRGMLMCILMKALEMSQIVVQEGKGQKILWETDHWKQALSKGITEPWDRDTGGQNMLVATTCIMRGLSGYEATDYTSLRRDRDTCRHVWEQLTIELEDPAKVEEDRQITKLSDMISKLKKEPDDPSATYRKVGLLLSIYTGMKECLEYGRPYELRGFIKPGGWDISRIGSCEMEGDTLNCDGGQGLSSQARINLWKKELMQLTEEPQIPPKPTRRLQLITGDTSQEVEKIKQENQRKANETAAKISQTMTQRHEAARDNSVIYGDSPQTMTAHPKSQKEEGTGTSGKDKETGTAQPVQIQHQKETVHLPNQNLHQELETRLNPLPSDDGQHSNDETVSSQTHAEGVNLPEQSDATTKSQRDPKGEQLRNSPEDRILPQGTPKQSIPLSPILGAAVSLLLGLCGIYGLYRVYSKPSKLRIQGEAEGAGTKRRVTYGPLKVD
ncbi:hypothetical protein C922_05433 [Plasmodium inui San Antonio 1]|uniref:Uncharacterized protein n=1 Tax=Plasmodium inui San Antonio 1 TaxID=1237626 RepID=W6ZY24_9APIC|nr:hypothetical protein C922_05433 [Plasmodium inui San Antonio 1]EUD64180.1 hypothetical protein C922_05433 [Plasmodium inui San Antonio 1]